MLFLLYIDDFTYFGLVIIYEKVQVPTLVKCHLELTLLYFKSVGRILVSPDKCMAEVLFVKTMKYVKYTGLLFIDHLE